MFLFCCFVIFLISFVTTDDNIYVEQVHILSRYCDRTPFTYFEIPNNPVNWTIYGQLTGLGMHQCHKLGQMMRNRYLDPKSEFHIKGINLEYNDDDYYFQSSFYPRDTASLNSAVQGLFPDNSDVSPKYIDPNPPHKKKFDALPNGTTMVPIQSTQTKQDVVLESLVNCPQYEEDLGNYYDSDDWKSYQRERQEDMDYVLKALGIHIEYSLEFFQWIYDTVWAMKKHNKFTEMNLTDTTFGKLKSLADFVTLKIYSRDLVGTKGGGKFVERVYDGMNDFINGKYTKKFNYYLTDSTTFISVFTALLLMDDYPSVFGVYPEDGASVIFELSRKNNTKERYVRIIYLSAYDSDDFESYKLISLGGIGCDDPCPFSQYKIINQQAWSENWCSDCDNDEASECMVSEINDMKHHNLVFWILIGVIFAIILALVAVFPVMIIVDYLRKKKKFKTS